MKGNLVRYSVAFMLMVSFMLPIILVDVLATSVNHMTPTKGKAGTQVNIIGDGFNDCSIGSFTVRFAGYVQDGNTSFAISKASPAEVKNDQLIKTNVPDLPLGSYDVSIMCDAGEIPAGTFTVI